MFIYIACSNARNMKGNIVVFRLPPRTNNTSLSKFCQKFYGQNTSSWGGKYKYRRKGLLDEIPYHKLLRGVIIIRMEDLHRVVTFLEEYSAEIHVRTIELTPNDCEKLEISLKTSSSD